MQLVPAALEVGVPAAQLVHHRADRAPEPAGLALLVGLDLDVEVAAGRPLGDAGELGVRPAEVPGHRGDKQPGGQGGGNHHQGQRHGAQPFVGFGEGHHGDVRQLPRALGADGPAVDEPVVRDAGRGGAGQLRGHRGAGRGGDHLAAAEQHHVPVRHQPRQRRGGGGRQVDRGDGLRDVGHAGDRHPLGEHAAAGGNIGALGQPAGLAHSGRQLTRLGDGGTGAVEQGGVVGIAGLDDEPHRPRRVVPRRCLERGVARSHAERCAGLGQLMRYGRSAHLGGTDHAVRAGVRQDHREDQPAHDERQQEQASEHDDQPRTEAHRVDRPLEWVGSIMVVG